MDSQFFFTHDSFRYPDSYVSIHEFYEFFSIPFKNIAWIFDGECIMFVNCFWRMLIFTILILPIFEDRIAFHFLVSFSVSFFRDWKLPLWRSFHFTLLVTLLQDILLSLQLLGIGVCLWSPSRCVCG